MKSYKFLLSILLTVTFLSQVSFALPTIYIQSRNYSVWGCCTAGGVGDSYSFSDSEPVSANITFENNISDPQDPFYGNNRVHLVNYTEDFGVGAGVWTGGFSDAAAYAYAEWIFTSDNGWFEFDISPDFFYNQRPAISLIDLTTNDLLLDQHCSYNETLSFYLEDSHEYKMFISAAAFAATVGGESDYTSMQLNIHNGVVFIPTPSAVILGSIGVGFITWLRRRRKL